MNEQTRSNPVQAATAEASQTSPPATPSLEEIYNTHHGLVFRAAYRVTGNAADAEDVLQTVFLRLVRQAEPFAAVTGVESYLYRAATNAALDLVRSRRRAGDLSLNEAAPRAMADSRPAPDRTFESGEIRRWLREAVGRMHPSAAETFVLRFFEGLRNQEIAQILGTSPGTVAVTLHRTREKLEREFRAYCAGSGAPNPSGEE